MKTWFEEWEKENRVADSIYYKEKISENESVIDSTTHKPKKIRESAHVRGRKYKTNLLKRYNHNTIWDGYYSLSLYHYYMPDPDNKPTVIKPIRGEFIWCEWAGPSFTKRKKRETNRKVRRMKNDELLSIGKGYKKLFGDCW